MWRRIRVAFWMIGTIAVLTAGSWCNGRYEGCGMARTKPPKPTCGLVIPGSPRGVAAALVRSDPQWLLARDADDVSVVMTGVKTVFVFPASERRSPEMALADAVLALPPDIRPALHRTQFLLVWLGREHDATGEGVRYPSWDRGLDLQVFHDVLTPQGCLMREAPADDPEDHISRYHANQHMGYIQGADAALAKVLRSGSTTPPFSAEESAARMKAAAPQLRDIAIETQREDYRPISALVILGAMLVFYWWAASAGKEESFIELESSELRGDGALVTPGRINLRVLSYALLHLDMKHLVNNGLAIYIGCALLEIPLGSARTLLVFLAGVIGGALGPMALRNKKQVVVGASGGAFALQAATLVLLMRSGVWYLPDERSAIMIFIVIQLVFNLAASFMPGVSMAGHVGGALAGFLVTVTGLVLIGRPPLDGGSESAFSAHLAWIIAGVAVAAWIASGVLVQRGRTDLTAKSSD